MADEYEREHMPGVGQMLYRHKVTAPRWVMALTAGMPFLFGSAGAVVAAMAGEPLGAFSAFVGGSALSALMVAISVTFATGRIAVSEGQVHIQLGFAGPKIPIAEVASAHIGPSGRNNYGMGVKKNLDGTTLFSLFGDSKRAVHIVRHGHPPIILACKEPEALLEALQEAIRRHAMKTPRVRVDVGTDAAEDEQAIEEAATAEARAAKAQPR